MSFLRDVDPELYQVIGQEIRRQHENIELIASENFASQAVLEAQGSVLTNKYAEGYPNARWYGGCEHVDSAEELAIERAKQLFGAEHVNVQPHSGTQANMAVFCTVLSPGDPVLAMDLACGGHLSHGHPLNFSGKYFKIIPYGVDRQTERIDYDQLMALAKEHRPKMVIAGASAYPRVLEFERFRQVADAAGAVLLVDMAHIAGLVAAGVHPSPIPHAEFVTTTTHKTLRGPRGGMIFCRKEFAKKIDRWVFPGIQGGPLMHVVAAKAVALKEALQPSFRSYQEQVVANARALAASLAGCGFRIVSGGTDNHLLLADLRPKGVTGKEAVEWLDRARITVNKNLIPYDPQPALVTSGIRLGTPAATARGLKEPQMRTIAQLIDEVLVGRGEEVVLSRVRASINALTEQFPLYPELRPVAAR